MTGQREDQVGWRLGVVAAIAGWLWARVCIAIGFVVAHRSVELLDNPGGTKMISEGLFVWDGAYYRVLAESWYGGANPDAARFFPLYPALARALAPLFGHNAEVSLLVISNLSALIGAVVLARLVYEVLTEPHSDQPGVRYGQESGPIPAPADRWGGAALADRWGGWSNLRCLGSDSWQPTTEPETAAAVATRAAWMVGLFPAGFVLAFAYTESLALVLTAGCLLALVRKQFLVAAALSLLAAMLRPVGGLLLIPIAIEAWRSRRTIALWRASVALVAPVVGIVTAFVWIDRSTDDPLRPLRLQQQIRGGFQDPFTRVLEPIGEMFKGNFRDVYNFGFMVVFLFLGYQAVRFRQPASWLAFALCSGVILYSSQVTDSLGRYGLVVVPFVVALAQWADTRWKQWLYGVCASAAMIWIVSEAMIGRLVP